MVVGKEFLNVSNGWSGSKSCSIAVHDLWIGYQRRRRYSRDKALVLGVPLAHLSMRSPGTSVNEIPWPICQWVPLAHLSMSGLSCRPRLLSKISTPRQNWFWTGVIRVGTVHCLNSIMHFSFKLSCFQRLDNWTCTGLAASWLLVCA